METIRLLAAALFLSLGSGAVSAQQPLVDEPPSPGGSMSTPESLTGVDCNVILPYFDASTPTGDLTIVGVAKSETNGKWFVSGRNGSPSAANQRIWIFDSDEIGRPDAATVRSIPQAPLSVFIDWGHRDGEWDPVGGKVYFGDDARQLLELDPVTETWTGNAWALPSGPRTLRAVAIRSDPSTGNLLLYTTIDLSPLVEEYILAPGTGANSVVLSGPRSVGTIPYVIYGLTIVDGPAGPNSALAAFSQVPMTCTPGVGLHRVIVCDIATGAILWSRSGDVGVPGGSARPNGGVAGGIQIATVAGQRVLAVVQQATNDAIAFLPFQGFAQHGANECNDAYLFVDGSPALGGSTGFRVARALPLGLALVFVDVHPGFALPIGCGVLDAGVSFPPFPIAVDAQGRGSVGPFPIPNLNYWDGVVLYADAVLADPTSLASTNPLGILLTGRCW